MSNKVIELRKGFRFYHARLIGPDGVGTQLCTITAVRRGVVYYCIGEGKRGQWYVDANKFAEIVGSVADA